MRPHLLFLLAASQIAAAQTAPATVKTSELAPLTVTGIAPDAFILPGSAAIIEGEEFRSKG